MTDSVAAPIRVLVADCKRLWTELLVETLRQDSRLEAVASVSSPEGFVAEVKAVRPDVVLIGAGTDSTVFRVLREAHAELPALHSVVLLTSTEGELIRESFHAGARGVLVRDDPTDVIIECLHCVSRGRVWARIDQFACFLEFVGQYGAARAVVDPTLMESLTRREVALIECVAKGLTNREIASRLHLSEHTVRNYLFRVFRKLGVSNRAELVSSALHRSKSEDLSLEHA